MKSDKIEFIGYGKRGAGKTIQFELNLLNKPCPLTQQTDCKYIAYSIEGLLRHLEEEHGIMPGIPSGTSFENMYDKLGKK